jgi:ribosome-associated toxin RatA of RatAB toxin-antitoxin module
MANAKTSEIFNASIERVYKVLSDYGAYPDFLPEVKRASILESGSEKKLVEFEVSVIKTFRYQLWFQEIPNSQVAWKFHSGEVFKENSGVWTLKDLGDGKTRADYEINAKFGLFVPGMIEKKLIEVNFPIMMKAFKKQIETL